MPNAVNRNVATCGGFMNWREPRGPDVWIELRQPERDEAWNRVDIEFGFAPSMQAGEWPGFAEPARSTTWSVAPLFTEDRIDSGLAAVGEGLREALDASRGDDDFVLVLDWQHPGYRFHPQLAAAPVDWESWLVPALPDGDYYLFLAIDFRFGWLTHPWEQTVCCFGDLLPRMRPVLDGLGLDVIREGDGEKL